MLRLTRMISFVKYQCPRVPFHYVKGLEGGCKASQNVDISEINILQDTHQLQQGRWHNGSAFVFCTGDCPFESESTPTSAGTCGKWLAVMPAVKMLAGVAPEVDLRECTLHFSPQNEFRTNPSWLWNPEETSPDVQNRGTSGSKIGHMCPPKKDCTTYSSDI